MKIKAFLYQPASFFVAVALVFGSAFVVLIPPFQAPDEVNHFLRAYHISEGHAFGMKTDDQRFGGYLPQSLAEIADTFRPLRYNYTERTSFQTIQHTLSVPLRAEQRIFLDFPNVAYYSPTAYVPQPPLFLLLRMLKTPPLWMLYLGRWITLLFWTILVFWAIKIIPFHKWTLTLLALLPASLFLHASLTADTTTNALAFLLIACIMKMAFSDVAVTYPKLLFVLLLSLLITINKVVYSPLVLLLWLIPVQKYGSWKNSGLTNAAILLLHGLVLWWWYQKAGQLFMPYGEYNPLYRDDQQLNPGVESQAQLQFVLQHPFVFMKTLIISYAESSKATLAHFIGKFGWEHNYLPLPVLLALVVLVITQALTEKNEAVALKNWHRWWMVLLAIGMMLAFSIVIYMQWSPPGYERIRALAGRYFIPIVPLFLLAMYNQRWELKGKWWPWVRLAVVVLAQVAGVVAVLGRYYL